MILSGQRHVAVAALRKLCHRVRGMARDTATTMKRVLASLALAGATVTAPPAWGLDQFFARVEASYWAPGPGMLTIANTSGFLAHDVATGFVRLDQTTHMRALSSGSSFVTPNAWSTVTDANATRVARASVGTADAGACFASAPARPFPMVGATIARWMDPAYQSFWHNASSARLGAGAVRGEAVEVWGWDAACVGIPVTFPTCTFRAYVRAAAPRVLLREEYWQYGTPYPLNGTADFYDYENAGESFDYMMKSGLFDAPAACAR